MVEPQGVIGIPGYEDVHDQPEELVLFQGGRRGNAREFFQEQRGPVLGCAKVWLTEFFHMFVSTVGIRFQEGKNTAELAEGISDKEGILKEISTLVPPGVEPANGDQQGENPVLGRKYGHNVEDDQRNGEDR